MAEQIVQLLGATFRDGPQRLEAERILLATAAQCPEGYPNVLQQIIVNGAIDQSIRQAAVTQLRILFQQNPGTVLGQGIPILVAISGAVPDEFQRTLELLAWEIVRVFNAAGQLPGLLTAAGEIIASDNPIIGLLLMDSVLDRLKEEAWIPFIEAITQCLLTNMRDNYICWYYYGQCILNRVKKSSGTMKPPEVMCFLEMAVRVVGESTYGSEVYDVKSTWLEVIVSLLMSFGNAEINAQPIFAACIEYLRVGHTRDGYTNVLSILNGIMLSETIYPSVADKVAEMMMIIAPAFKVSEEEAGYFMESHEDFIENVFPATFEACTPRSAAMICMKTAANEHPELALIALALVSANLSEDAWTIFQWMHFMSCASSVLPPSTENLPQFFELVMNYMRSGNPVLMIAGFQILANFPEIPEAAVQFIPLAMEVLVGDAPEAIAYAAASACGRLFQIASPTPEAFPLEVVNTASQRVLAMSQKYETECMAQAVTSFVGAFGSIFAGFAEAYIGHCVALFRAYMDSEDEWSNRSAYEFSNSITTLCQYVQNHEVFDAILTTVQNFIDNGYVQSYCEDIIPLIGGCVYNARILTPGLANVPRILMNIYMEMGGPPDFIESITVSSILRTYACKFGAQKSDEIVQVIMTMTQGLVEDGCETDDDQTALTTFGQILFIVLKREDVMPAWMPIFGTLGGEFMFDIAAAMVQLNPVMTLSCEGFINIWVQATAVPFLSSYISAISQWASLPPEIQALQPNFLAVVQEKLQEMMAISAEDLENAELFDIEAIKALFAPKQ